MWKRVGSSSKASDILGKLNWPESISCYHLAGLYVLFTIRANAVGGNVDYYNTGSSYSLIFNSAGLMVSGTYGDCVAGVTTITTLQAANRTN